MTTTLSGSALPGASLGALRAAAAGLLLATSAARADGLRFEGDLPDAPHVLIDLTQEQLQEVSRSALAGKRWPFPEIQLTRAQRDLLRESTGAEVRWLFVAKKEWLAGDCTCGTYNLGVITGTRLAVLQMGLGDHLGSRDLAAMERALVDPALRGTARGLTPAVVRHQWQPGGEAPEPPRALAERFPGRDFERHLALRDGWKAQRVRVAAIPRVSDIHEYVAVSLHSLSAVATRPAPDTAIDWPALGARLDVDGRVYVLLPGIAEGELGPKARAWFLLEYQGGRITAAVARSEWGWTGATYDWTALAATNAARSPCEAAMQATEAYKEMSRAFPEWMKIDGDECNVIEFCPDETCDEFTAERGPPATLVEFAYLYLYAFSGYYDLASWRSQREARNVASRLLTATRHKECWRADEKEAARCVLRLLAGKGKIRLFSVRYDENARHATQKDIP